MPLTTGNKYVAIHDRYDTDEDTGLVVEVKIDRVDHEQLGAWVARMNDRDQAAVIDGLATRLHALGHNGSMQIAYLVQELRKSPAQAQIEWLITELYEQWTEG